MKARLRFSTLFVILLCTGSSFAEEMLPNQLETLQTQLEQEASNQKNEVEHLNDRVQKKVIEQNPFLKNDLMKSQQVFLNSIQQGNVDEKEKYQTGLMIFVSLSMPTIALRQILQDAQTYHFPVVIRGLVNNRFPDTTKRLEEILHPEHGEAIQSGVQIDPIYFRQFAIQQVPAVVSYHKFNHCSDSKEMQDCQKPEFDVVYGNIPLKKALTILATSGKMAPEVAKQALDTVGDNHEAV